MTTDTAAKRVLTKEWIVVGCMIIVMGLLLLLNLQNHYLWQDEAQTALIAKTVMERGVPYGTDGKNYFSQELGAEYGPNHIWKWHTWLPFYIMAGFFKVFGVSTFTARLPYSLFGIGIVPLLYFYTKTLFKSKRIAAFTIILLVSCVPFLILMRQCRYYSMTAFFSLLGLYAYQLILEKRRFSILLFIVASTLLFHTHYIYFATLLGACGLHCLWLRRDRWCQVGTGCIGAVLLATPWIIWLSTMKYEECYGDRAFNLRWTFLLFISFLSKIHQHVVPAYLSLIPLLLFIFLLTRKQGRYFKEHLIALSPLVSPAFFGCITIIALSWASPYPFIRYLSPVIPVVFIIAGIIVNWAYQFRWYAGWLIVGLLVSLNPVGDFIYELTHDYDGPIEGIVKFLDKNAGPDDIVVITYGDMPLKFYTNLRVIGGMTGEDLSPSKDAKWIIIRKHIFDPRIKAVADYIVHNIDSRNYRRIQIDYPDIPFENRESPKEHFFRTVTSVPNVTIFKRVQSPGRNQDKEG